MRELEIRTASPADAAAIAAVLSAAFLEYQPLYTPKGYAATTPDESVIRNRFAEGKTWVAVSAGKVVGTVSVIGPGSVIGPVSVVSTVSVVPRRDSLHIRSMAILPEARGHRLGERLLSEIEHYAHAHGFRKLTLSTTPFLDRAVRLYEKFGFAPCGSDDLIGTPLITMEKELT